ncbi:MAG: M48 family metalloprotease [Alphaproteobacteria bacterium]
MFRFFLIFCLLPFFVFAKGQKIQGIRDTEIEFFLQKITNPIFKSANLSPDSVHVHLIADSSPNAFVAKGQNLFIHAGLFILADHENEIVGVLAHETGHIKGGHLSRLAKRLERTQLQAMMGVGAGLATMLLGGSTETSEAGMAIMIGSTDFAQKSLLAYSRDEERMADEIGLQLLDKTNQSAQGFLSFMNKLKKRQDLLMGENISPYRLTHPLTKDRKKYIIERLETSRTLKKENAPPSQEFMFVKAKSVGYFQPRFVDSIFQKKGLYWHYAKGFGDFRQKKYKSALKHFETLIKEKPKNGYFYEAKAQVLFEMGQIKNSLKAYKISLNLLEDPPLIEMEFCAASLESNSVKLDELETHLNVILLKNQNLRYAYKLLATLYGKQGKKGKMHYALAEYYAAIGDKQRALKNLIPAEKLIKKDSLLELKIEDLKQSLKK